MTRGYGAEVVRRQVHVPAVWKRRQSVGQSDPGVCGVGRCAEQVRAETLCEGEEHQQQSDDRTRRPHLLGGKSAHIASAETEHAEGRRSLDPHQRQGIGEDHRRGPDAPGRRLLAESRGELDHAGNLEQLRCGAVALRAELRECRAEGGKAAELHVREAADCGHPAEHQQALQRPGCGHRPHAAEVHIDEDAEPENPHRGVLADGTAGQQLKHLAGGCELHADERDREHQRDQYGQEADQLALVVVGEHGRRRRMAESLPEQPLALEKQNARQRNDDRAQRHFGVRKAVDIDHRRMAEDQPSGQ